MGQALKADQKGGHAFEEDRKAGSQALGEFRKVWGRGALSKMINKKIIINTNTKKIQKGPLAFKHSLLPHF